MKTKNHKYESTVIVEKDEDGMLVATVPAIPACHTQARDMNTLMKRIKEVIELCLEEKKVIPSLKFVGLQEVEVSV